MKLPNLSLPKILSNQTNAILLSHSKETTNKPQRKHRETAKKPQKTQRNYDYRVLRLFESITRVCRIPGS